MSNDRDALLSELERDLDEAIAGASTVERADGEAVTADAAVPGRGHPGRTVARRMTRGQAETIVNERRGETMNAMLSGPSGERRTTVTILSRVRVIAATWDPDADDGWGAMRGDELRLVRVSVEGEVAVRSISVDRLWLGLLS